MIFVVEKLLYKDFISNFVYVLDALLPAVYLYAIRLELSKSI